MKNLLFALSALIFSAAPAFAGMDGTIACDSPKDGVVANYHWFHSQADSYADAFILVMEPAEDTPGAFKMGQYEGMADRALAPITIKTKYGKTVTVTPDLKNNTCHVSVK